jgi:hypothetical protein
MNGYANFTLTPGQVVTPELSDLLTEEEAQVLVSHQDQADGTLDALDTLMAWIPATGQQHEVNLQDLITHMQRNQNERCYYKWVTAAVALTLILLLIYLTSKCW